MTSLIVFVVSLPLAVWVLAGLISIIDTAEKGPAVLSAVVRALLALMLALAAGTGHRWPMLVSFALVICLHVGLVVGGRKLIESGRWRSGKAE